MAHEETSSSDDKLPLITSAPKPARYWSTKFIFFCVTLILLAIIAGYLQYVAYPALMTAPTPDNGGNGFGESNVVLNLSFLTFQLNANGTCGNSSCRLIGIPAFDFCQAMIYFLIIASLVQLYNRRAR